MMLKHCVVLATVLSALSVPDGLSAQEGNIVTIEQYEQIAEPLYDAAIPTLSFSLAGQAMVPFLEAWRLTNRWFLETADAMVDDATAVAITTNAIKNLKIQLHPVKERSFLLIEKLKKDLAIYEDMYPELKGGLMPSSRSDPEKVEAEKHYQAIKAALKRYQYTVKLKRGDTVVEENITLENAEERLKQDTAVVHGDLQNRREKPGKIMEVLQRLTRARVPLSQIDPTMKFLAEPLTELRKTQAGIEQMANALKAHSPKKQLYIRLENHAEDMNYQIQIQTRDKDGNYRPRSDTFYPVMLVRRRGQEYRATSYWLPVNLGDKLVIQALTMNEYRREILYKPIDRYKVVVDGKERWERYKFVRPEMNSWSRTPYVLGYEVEQGAKKLVTRLYSVEETYNWTFSGGWTQGAGEERPQLKTSDGRKLRELSEPLQMHDDRMEWVVPDTWAKAAALARPENVMTAEVSGEAIIVRRGPTSASAPQRLVDRGSGRLVVILDVW